MGTGTIGRLGVAALLVVTVGCSTAAEKVGEKAVERSLEENGGEANVDLSDGKIQVSDGDGGTYEIDASGDASLPDGFPSELEVPGTTKVVQASSSSAEGSQLMSITVQFDGSLTEAFDAYQQQLVAAGYEVENESSGGTEGDAFGQVLASDDVSTVAAIFALDGDGRGTASVNVTPRQP